MEDNRAETEAFLRSQLERLRSSVTDDDLLRYGGYEQQYYASLTTEDRYWAIVHTRTNKLFVEGVLRIVAGRTNSSELSLEDTRRLIELGSPAASEGLEDSQPAA